MTTKHLHWQTAAALAVLCSFAAASWAQDAGPARRRALRVQSHPCRQRQLADRRDG